MKADVNHIQLNVRPENLPFYRDLTVGYLGWRVIFEMDGYFGAGAEGSPFSLWFSANGTTEAANDYDGPGMNHLAFGVTTQAEVDDATAYFKGQGIEPAFGTPLHDQMPPPNESNTYYRAMFESPDGILLEFAYSGPRS